GGGGQSACAKRDDDTDDQPPEPARGRAGYRVVSARVAVPWGWARTSLRSRPRSTIPGEMELERHLLESTMVDSGTDAEVRMQIELRVDPLTGHSSRILPERGLMPPADFDLQRLARQTAETCPFCPERIERSTPRLAPEIAPSGRVTRGEAVLFPNLHAYASHSVVSVYSVDRHYLP